MKPSAVEQIDIRTLDSIADQWSPNEVGFLKIGVKGYELEVLKSGTRVLREFRPKLAMETHAWGPPAKDISQYLEAFGYKVVMEPYHSKVGLLYAG